MDIDALLLARIQFAFTSREELVSATWILASNSCMQTAQGHEIINGRVVPVDWRAVIFNPSFPYRWAHMVGAAFLSTALVVGASAEWHRLRGRDNAPVRTMMAMAMRMVLVTAPIQALRRNAATCATLSLPRASQSAWAHAGLAADVQGSNQGGQAEEPSRRRHRWSSGIVPP